MNLDVFAPGFVKFNVYLCSYANTNEHKPYPLYLRFSSYYFVLLFDIFAPTGVTTYFFYLTAIKNYFPSPNLKLVGQNYK